jgi:hypothetical protein
MVIFRANIHSAVPTKVLAGCRQGGFRYAWPIARAAKWIAP